MHKGRLGGGGGYHPADFMPLYFAYTAQIDPTRLASVAPGARFKFIAHLPETRLIFPFEDEEWGGGLPSVEPLAGNTVWGAIFDVPAGQIAGLNAAEATEGRVPDKSFKAVDREGGKHDVLTHVHAGAPNGAYAPSRDYMELVVAGGRHWGLPTGWVAGLEEYVEDPLF